MRAYYELVRIDLALALRDKGVIFFTYLLPLVFFLGFAGLMGTTQGGSITQVVSMVLLLGILGNGLFGAGMRTVADREQNILRRFRVAPISPTPLLVASIITGWIIYLPAVIGILLLAIIGFGMEMPRHPFDLLLILTLGIFTFRSLGLILASVANSMQEINILVQLVYLPMLFLSGALFPITILPEWVQIFSQYLPATYLVTAFQGALLRNETLLANAVSVLALVVTLLLALFISARLFRWEKGQKVPLSSKLWVVAVLTPFLILGTAEAFNRGQIRRAKVLHRQLQRSDTFLIRGARLFIGDGSVIENGSVLVREGRIERVFDGPPVEELDAEIVEAGGKTLLPGLIDSHVHLSAPGGLLPDGPIDPEEAMSRALAAYLYSGVTAVRSVGDPLSLALDLRDRVSSGELLGADLLVASPMFTTPGGHGTEYFAALPEQAREAAQLEWLRLPSSEAQARAQVTQLQEAGVDGIKVILESGWAGRLFERLDSSIFAAIADQSRRLGLPLSVHTGDSRDVEDAIAAGAASIEHGSHREAVPESLLQQAAQAGVYYAPTLSVIEALLRTAQRDDRLLRRTLVMQAAPEPILETTRLRIDDWIVLDADQAQRWLETARRNLVAAAVEGVGLSAGTDSGNFLLPHGPAIHRELQLWVEAGLTPAQALIGATSGAALLLGADRRFGSIREGLEASFLLVDGNPLIDIRDTERISMVIFKGERISRSRLFDR